MNYNKPALTDPNEILKRVKQINEFLDFAREGRQIELNTLGTGFVLVWETISGDKKRVALKLVKPNYREIDNKYIPFGGTMSLIYGQLTRYILGHSHHELSLVTQKMFSLRNFNGGAEQLQAIKSKLPEFYTGFQNANDIACILCGGIVPEWGSNSDWWTDKKMTGPCCQYAKCQEVKQHAS